MLSNWLPVAGGRSLSSGPGVKGNGRHGERSKRGALSWQSNPGDLKLPNEYFIGQTERRIGELHSVNLRRMTGFLFCLATSSIFIWLRNSRKNSRQNSLLWKNSRARLIARIELKFLLNKA
jgi:hypothetical protein